MTFQKYSFLILALPGATPAIAAPVTPPSGIPITFTLPKAGIAAVVIEDAQGNRVRNLIAETPLPAGKNALAANGCDEGIRTSGDGGLWDHSLIRHTAIPGIYTVRGLA